MKNFHHFCFVFALVMPYFVCQDSNDSINEEVFSSLRDTEDVCNTCVKTDVDIRPRIIGGTDAFEEFPHHAILSLKLEDDNLYFVCGGSLISMTFIVTAAHCFENIPFQVVATLGRYDRFKETEGVTMTVKNIFIHPNFRDKNYHRSAFDIALLQIQQVEFTDAIRPISLPVNDADQYENINVTIIGYGKTGGDPAKYLKKASLVTILNSDCKEFFPELAETELCATDKNNSGCDGDSGGSMINKKFVDGIALHELIGIMSFGGDRKCTPGIIPNGFVRVSKFLDWITNTTAIDKFN